MTSHPETWARVLLLFAACIAVIADRPVILGDEHGYILGWSRNMSCVVMSPLSIKNKEILRWLLDGKPLTAHGKQISTISNVFVYTLFLILPVTAQLNGKHITCQSFINPSKVEEITETILVIKLVEKPQITGPSKVIVGLPYTWYCVADGATRGPPDIRWFFGNDTSITEGYRIDNTIYDDKDNLLTYNTSSTLVLKASETDTTISVYCQTREKDTEPAKVSSPVHTQVIHCLRRKEFLQEGVDASKYDFILNNGFFEFELPDLEVDEPDHEATRTVSVKVLRQCNSTNEDVVKWEASNNGGREDLEDYSGNIHFRTGDISAPLNLVVRNDDIPELEETILVRLVEADKGIVTDDPEKSMFSLKIRANDDPYGYFVLPGPTLVADRDKVDVSITRKGGAFGAVEVIYQVTPPVHVSRGPDVTDTNSSGYGRVMFAENKTVSHLLLPRDASKSITVKLLSARLISSPQETPVPNSPRLGTINERQITMDVDVGKEETIIKPNTEQEKKEDEMKPKDKDKEQTVDVAGFTDYEARPLSTKDILYVILPALLVIFTIMIISMCCCCAFCGIIRKACRVGDERKCICCRRVCCVCTPIYGVIDEDNAKLTKSEN